MGVRIGTYARDLAADRPASFAQARRQEGKIASPPEGAAPSGRNRADTVQVGFGENTVSGPAVALHAVSTNLERSRPVVPSLQELQDESRAQREEQRVRIEEAAPPPQDDRPAPETLRPEPAPQAQNFVQETVPPPPQPQPQAPPANEPTANTLPNGSTPNRIDVLV